jgi:hypothetical protein
MGVRATREVVRGSLAAYLANREHASIRRLFGLRGFGDSDYA